ncbi:MAG: ABC transporter ATP-binding protein [Actinomycetia bacterium]|nr:ABC transporter ATP-binding protein [Actinomycetes bacterium]
MVNLKNNDDFKNDKNTINSENVINDRNDISDKNTIIFDSVSKSFRIYHEVIPSLKETIIRGKRSTFENFLALDDISFKVKRGETFGIIGPNGSGKTTILKLISGIIQPTEGKIAVNGSLSALLELGAGFHPDLTGRENIFLNASLLGIPRKKIEERFNDIVKFSGLARFIDTPVKNYSSGMYVRLGFTIAINVDPDILLIDEVLAVGDRMFQEKCKGVIQNFKDRGKTIVIVSHDLDAIAKYCTKAILLIDGNIVIEDEPNAVIRDYLSYVAQKEAELAVKEKPIILRRGTSDLLITNIQLIDKNLNIVKSIYSNDKIKIAAEVLSRNNIKNPVFGLQIDDEEGTKIYETNTDWLGKDTGIFIKDRRVKVTFSQKLNLNEGAYYLTVYAKDRDSGNYYDLRERALIFNVRSKGKLEGIVDLGTEFSLEEEKNLYAVKFISDTVPDKMRKDEIYTINLKIQNESKFPWQDEIENPNYPVRIGYRWIDEKGETLPIEGIRTFLGKTINPDEILEIKVNIKSPMKEGKYLLKIDLVKEFFSWFSDLGGDFLQKEILVE